jgi:hypothetical protein
MNAPKNSSLDGLYMAMGRAISNWAIVEIQLYQLFTISMSLTAMQPGGGYSTGSETPGAVLDAVDGWRAKLQMIAAALQSALGNTDEDGQAILNDWATEQETINSLHSLRNKIAHWTAERLIKRDGSEKVRLRPPFYSLNKSGNVWQSDIEAWEKQFQVASIRLVYLAERLARHRGLQRKFVEQVASQALCCLPDDPTLLEHLKQQLSEHL